MAHSHARRRVIAIGPLPPPITGFSVITARMLERLSEHYDVRSINVAPATNRRGVAYHLSRLRRVVGAVVALMGSTRREGDVAYLGCEGGSGLVYTACLCAIARIMGHRIFLHHHSFSYIDRAKPLMRLVLAIAGNKLVHIFLCPEMRDRFSVAYARTIRSVIVSNLAFVESCDALERPAAPASAMRVGLLSNLNREKGLHLFLDLLRTARKRGLNIEGLLAGPATDPQDRLAIATAQEELAPMLTYLGPVYGPEKQRFYEAIDAFVFPTIYAHEAQPTVLYEAMAHGARVISFNRGCIGAQVGADGCVVAQDADFVEEALAALSSLIDAKCARETRRSITRQRYAEAHRQMRNFAANIFEPEAQEAETNPCAS